MTRTHRRPRVGRLSVLALSVLAVNAATVTTALPASGISGSAAPRAMISSVPNGLTTAERAEVVTGGQVSLVSHVPGSSTTAANLGAAWYVSPTTSADGAFVAFGSESTDLVPGQSDAPREGNNDIFLYERATATVTLVSHASGSVNTTADGASSEAFISADGAFVAFVSEAKNLVPGQSDANSGADVFIYERATRAVTLVSHIPGGANMTANRSSSSVSISADGSFVTFVSQATNLVAGQGDLGRANDADVFVYERATGSVTLVSHTPASANTTANGPSYGTSVSGDGAFVAFASQASNLVPGQGDAPRHTDLFETQENDDVFLYERATGTVTLVSHVPTSVTTTGNGRSHDDFDQGFIPSMSADGAYVVFISEATNLVPGQSDADRHTNVHDGYLNGDIFLYERASATLTLVSHIPTSANATGNGRSSWTPSISADGSFVAFESEATNLVVAQAEANFGRDVFLYERATGSVTLISHIPTSVNTTINRPSYGALISADGTALAFTSDGTNVVPGQSGGFGTAVLYERPTASAQLVSRIPASATTASTGGAASRSLSADGRFVSFTSTGTDLVAGQNDTIDSTDAFLFDRLASAAAHVAPADFDADGDTDVSVLRPPNHHWFILDGAVAQFGTDGDIPVPADYDGDRGAEVAVFRPTTGYWFFRHHPHAVQFGTVGDVPVPADYNGDDKAEMSLYRPSDNFWFVGGTPVQFGTSGDIPVPGDYDGDGDTDIAVFRPSGGFWFVNGGPAVQFGTNGDIPVPGDYDGDGDTDIAVFRPSGGFWFVRGGALAQFGIASDVPVPGDYDGDGDTDFAVFRPSNGFWFVHNGPMAQWGASGDVPLPLPDAIRRFFFQPL